MRDERGSSALQGSSQSRGSGGGAESLVERLAESFRKAGGVRMGMSSEDLVRLFLRILADNLPPIVHHFATYLREEAER